MIKKVLMISSVIICSMLFIPKVHAVEGAVSFDYSSAAVQNHIDTYDINSKVKYLREYVDKNVLGKIHDGSNHFYTDYLIAVNGRTLRLLFFQDRLFPLVYNRLEGNSYGPVTISGTYQDFSFSMNNTLDEFESLVNSTTFENWYSVGESTFLSLKRDALGKDWNSFDTISFIYYSTFDIHVDVSNFPLYVNGQLITSDDVFPTYIMAHGINKIEEQVATSVYKSLEINLNLSNIGNRFDFLSNFEVVWKHRTDILDDLGLDRKIVPYLVITYNDGTILKKKIYDYAVDYAVPFSLTPVNDYHFNVGLDDSVVGGQYGYCFEENFSSYITSAKVVFPFDNFNNDVIKLFVDFSVPISDYSYSETDNLEIIDLKNFYGVVFSPKFTDHRLIPSDVYGNFRLEGAFAAELRFYDIEHPDAFKKYSFGEDMGIFDNKKAPLNYFEYVFNHEGVDNKRVALAFYNNGYTSMKSATVQYDTRYFVATIINSPFDSPIISDPNTGEDYPFEGSDDIYDHNTDSNSSLKGIFSNIYAFLHDLKNYSDVWNKTVDYFFSQLPRFVSSLISVIFTLLCLKFLMILGGWKNG